MVYETTGSPPLLPGALHVNVAARSPAVATKVCGAVAVAAGTAVTAAVIALSPMELVAAIRNISVTPFVKPVTVWVFPATPEEMVFHVMPSVDRSMR
jgi:hypothetical protein